MAPGNPVVGLLVKKLEDAILAPSGSSTVDQPEAPSNVIHNGKEAGVKKLSVKISQPAFK